YTSGSTGIPKGVGVTHGAASTHLVTIERAFALSADDRVLFFAACSFDVSLEQMLAPLCCGARLIVRGPELWDIDECVRTIRTHGLTVVNLPPAYWHQWCHAADSGAALAQLESLRLVIVGGDAISPEAVRRWQQHYPE